MTGRRLALLICRGLAASVLVMATARDLRAQAITSPPTDDAARMPALAHQAGAIFFPGSIAIYSGFASPLEDENVIVNMSFEQGFTLVRKGGNRIVPYVTLQGSGDRAALDWNNKAVVQVGMKYAYGFRSGVVQFGGGWAHERRRESGLSKGRPLWFGNYWIGWNGSISGRQTSRLASAFPGSSWATIGAPAPTEGKNVIAMVSVEQGVAAVRLGRTALIPFIEHTLAADSARRPWNNRQTVGEGIKLRVAIGRGNIEAAGIYRLERRWIEQRARAGITGTLNLWYGWDPSRRH